MLKNFSCFVLAVVSSFAVDFCYAEYSVSSTEASANTTTDNDTTDNGNYDNKGYIKEGSDFQPLADPDRKISGAYYGIGLGISNISNKLDVVKNDGTRLKHKQSANQFDLSLIGGFGTTLYSQYYAGVEFDFFKRLPKKTKWFDNEGVGIVHKSNIGLNMDVRFGYQFPQQGTMIYMTAGFARVLGEMLASNNGSTTKLTFGSFFPTAGLGVEHRMNQLVNIRADVRFSFGSKEKKNAVVNGSPCEFQGKPNRIAFRISVTRSF
ncbi:MAG: hypothetical protein IJT36_06550 [Alphaproteobacteria bacterium]|nr:hypothetical protein [Alphaproteobacteria bacterium]